MMTRCTKAGLLLMTFVVLGCGGVPAPPKEDLVPVSGVVKLGGMPVEGVFVSFVPAGSMTGQGSSAVTDAAGEYELEHAVTHQPGIPAGDYVVRFTKWVLPDGSPLPKDTPPHMANAVNQIPKEWGEQVGPHNSVKVPAGGKTFDFDIPAK